MGDIEVTCFMSNLPIRSGDETYFIPLLPGQHDRDSSNNQLLLSTEYSFVSNTAYFTPLCLPIEGIYGYYKTIENVVKNSNVEVIEKYFKMDINLFLDIIAEQESIYSGYTSNIFNKFIVNKSLFGKDVSFNPKYLLDLGFTVTNDVYTFKNLPIKVILSKNNQDNYTYQLIDYENNVLTTSRYKNTIIKFYEDVHQMHRILFECIY